MLRHKLMTSAAGIACILAFGAGSAAAQDAQSNPLRPFHGRISPFYGRISPFAGDVNPFWGRISPFSGEVDPFWGRLNPFAADATLFWGSATANSSANAPSYQAIGQFWSNVGPVLENLRATWRGVDANSSQAAVLRTQFQDLIAQSEAFWDAAARVQTGRSFREGFAAELLARYGINLDDPASFNGFTDLDRARFMFEWYDGLMNLSGRDHPDHWMATANWSPSLAQSVGAGRNVVIGLVDFNVSSDNVNMDQTLIWRGKTLHGFTHGEAVASLMAAPHDNRGVMGIAPNATIAAFNPFDESGTADWDRLAAGVNSVRIAGATVVNMSLGIPGSTFDPAWGEFYNRPGVLVSSQRVVGQLSGAIDGVTGVIGGVDTNWHAAVFVHAAGNEGVAQTQNINWNFLTDPAIIVVGSVGPSGTISSFSNTPGTACLMQSGRCQEALMNRFIVAPGEWLLTADGEGGVTRVSGTSFAAPLVSGAIALLHGHWPWLKDYARESAEVILSTARDLGAPGVDPIYGRGLLDIAASQAPINMANLYQRSSDGQRISLQSTSDGAVIALLGAVEGVLTVYEDIGSTYRDFRVPLTATLSSLNTTTTNSSNVLTATLSTVGSVTSTILKRKRFADDGAPVANPYGWDLRMSATPLPPSQFVHDGDLPYAFDLRLAANDGLTLLAGRGHGALALSGQTGFEAASYASDQGGANPILGLASGAGYAAAEVPLGRGMTLGAGVTQRRTQAFEADIVTGEERPLAHGLAPYESAAAHASLRQALSETVSLSAAYTYLREDNGLLGMQSPNPEAFAAGTETDAATFGLDWTASDRFGLALSGTYGRLRANGGQALAVGADGVAVSAFEATLAFGSVFAADDHARLRFGQPLHIEGGDLNVTTIDVVDRQTGALGPVTQNVELGGGARRYFLEGAYAAPVLGGRGEIAALARIETAAGGEADHFVGGRFGLSF